MKILENITGGYKKIATGIAIVSILALMYIALIPGGSLAAVTAQGIGIGGAFVKIVEWPQYNATTAPDGTYSINEMPVGTYSISAWAPGYATNTSSITVEASPAVTGKDFALNPNAKMVGFTWISSYDGNGNATSTMGLQVPRPIDIGTDYFGQFDSRKTTAGWLTLIIVSDVYGTGANLDVEYLYANGTHFNSTSLVVPVNGTLSILPGNSGILQGQIKFIADNPVSAEKRIIYYTPGTSNVMAAMSMLLPEKSNATTQFFGQYDSRRDTAGWLTVILVSDVFGTGANLNIDYLYSNGTIYNSTTQVVPVNGTASILPGNSGLLSGKIKINASLPVVAEKRIINYKLGTNEVKGIMGDSMATPNDAALELIVPKYDSRRSTKGWYSIVILSDIYGTGAAATVDYYDMNGTLYNSTNIVIPVNGSYNIVPGNTGVLEGRMNIHSNNLVVGEERVLYYNPLTLESRDLMSFNLLKQSDSLKDLTVSQYDSRSQWDTEIVVSPITESSTPDLNYFTNAAVLDHKELIDILVNGYYDFYPGDLTKGRLELGKLKIIGS